MASTSSKNKGKGTRPNKSPQFSPPESDLLVELVHKFFIENGGWQLMMQSSDWNRLTADFNKDPRKRRDREMENIRSRWRTMCTTQRNLKELSMKSGWDWDPVNHKLIVPSDAEWNAVVALNETKYGQLRNVLFPWFYTIDDVVGGSTASGSRATNRHVDPRAVQEDGLQPDVESILEGQDSSDSGERDAAGPFNMSTVSGAIPSQSATSPIIDGPQPSPNSQFDSSHRNRSPSASQSQTPGSTSSGSGKRKSTDNVAETSRQGPRRKYVKKNSRIAMLEEDRETTLSMNNNSNKMIEQIGQAIMCLKGDSNKASRRYCRADWEGQLLSWELPYPVRLKMEDVLKADWDVEQFLQQSVEHKRDYVLHKTSIDINDPQWRPATNQDSEGGLGHGHRPATPSGSEMHGAWCPVPPPFFNAPDRSSDHGDNNNNQAASASWMPAGPPPEHMDPVTFSNFMHQQWMGMFGTQPFRPPRQN